MVKVIADQKFFMILERLNNILALPVLLYINLANLYLSDPKNYSTVSEYNRLINENKPENILMYIPILLLLLMTSIYDLKQRKIAAELKKEIKYVISLMKVATILITMFHIILSLFSHLKNSMPLDNFANGLTSMMWLLTMCFMITETMEFSVSMKSIKSIVIYGLILLVIYGFFSIPNLIPSKYLLLVFTSIVYLYPKMVNLIEARFK